MKSLLLLLISCLNEYGIQVLKILYNFEGLQNDSSTRNSEDFAFSRIIKEGLKEFLLQKQQRPLSIPSTSTLFYHQKFRNIRKTIGIKYEKLHTLLKNVYVKKTRDDGPKRNQQLEEYFYEILSTVLKRFDKGIRKFWQCSKVLFFPNFNDFFNNNIIENDDNNNDENILLKHWTMKKLKSLLDNCLKFQLFSWEFSNVTTLEDTLNQSTSREKIISNYNYPKIDISITNFNSVSGENTDIIMFSSMSPSTNLIKVSMTESLESIWMNNLESMLYSYRQTKTSSPFSKFHRTLTAIDWESASALVKEQYMDEVLVAIPESSYLLQHHITVYSLKQLYSLLRKCSRSLYHLPLQLTRKQDSFCKFIHLSSTIIKSPKIIAGELYPRRRIKSFGIIINTSDYDESLIYIY